MEVSNKSQIHSAEPSVTVTQAADKAITLPDADAAPVDAAAMSGSEERAVKNGEEGPASAVRKQQQQGGGYDFDLKIKPEFMCHERPACLGPLPDNNNSVVGATTRQQDDRDRKKKQRGQNKKRPRDVRLQDHEKLCQSIVQGRECIRGGDGDACKFSHDMEEYLRTKPPDLDTLSECPLYEAFGRCKFGITCRLARCHTTQEGANLAKDEKDLAPPATPPVGNVADHSLITQLRKKQYKFNCQRRGGGGHKNSKGGRNGGGSNGGYDDASKKLLTVLDMDRSVTKRPVDFAGKVYVAPLTTVGNLPFRRIVKQHGADITCGEMAVVTNLLEGKHPEWSLIKRHSSEDVFGIQLAAGYADQFTRIGQVLEDAPNITFDFLDLNLGCPLDILCNKGAGAQLMLRDERLKESLIGLCNTLSVPVTIKMRTGWNEHKPMAHSLVRKIQSWGLMSQPNNIAAIMIHGRSRLQRYSKQANWDYIAKVSADQSDDLPKIPIIGNGDIFSYTDYEEKIAREGLEATAMLGRGALIKPWLPTEIKERRHWDISAAERLDILRDFVRFGLEHWGSDQQGVNTTRRFLLEWLSFLHRYIPVGLLREEDVPQQLNHRPPVHMTGRNDLETLFLSSCSYDWIKISEMLLGPVPADFQFEPKHKANSYGK